MPSTSGFCLSDDPADVRGRQIFAIVPTTLVLFLSILTYALRILARRKTRQELGWDDYLMGIGLIISIEPAICEFLLVANGLGHHTCNMSRDEQNRFLRISFALQRVNQPALACIKISIVLFLLRGAFPLPQIIPLLIFPFVPTCTIVFPTDSFRKAAYAVIAYNLAWAVSTWVVNLTVCTPIAYYYDKTIQGGSCRNQAVSGSINAGLALFGDILVLALPMPMIYGLKVNRAKKTALAGIFALGFFGCVASVIRIVELLKFTPTDASYTQVYASTWTTLEMGVAVISGNLPTLGPLVKIIWRRLGTSHDASTKKSGAFTSSHSGPRLAYNEPAEVNASARHNFERLSDSESQLEPSNTNDLELQESGIKVKKQITATRTSIGKP
ncbi:putative Integral membrane protein [Seiridium unicorne]|uniref:Integral membrane protein n=1 Tax=Seiridium unicorne TaxID=138068 RepID=A0ABR2VBC4_9PEZI